MLPIKALKDMHVLIATPNYDGAKANYTASIFSLGCSLAQVELKCQLIMLTDSNICRGRGRLLRRFLDGPEPGAFYTHLVFWDADVGSPREQVLRLLLSDKDVVAATYPLKRYELPRAPEKITEQTAEEFLARHVIYPDPGTSLTPDEQGFCSVKKLTTGMMVIKRSAIDRMIAAYPDEYYFYPGEPRRPHYAFFENILDKETRELLSEDYAFCKRWLDIGGEVFLDIYSRLSHTGTVVFNGDLMKHLKAVQPRPKILGADGKPV